MSRSYSEPAMLPSHATAIPLRVTFSWTLVGYIGSAACQWAMIAILARLGTREMVGQFALGLAISAPVIQTLNLQLRNVQVTDARQEHAFADYLALRLVTSTAALLLVGLIVTFGTFSLPTSCVVFGVSLWKAVEAVTETYYGLLQRFERMDRVAISQLLHGCSAVIVLSGVGFAGYSLFTGILAVALSSALLVFMFDAPSARHVLAHESARERETPLACATSLSPRWAYSHLRGLVCTSLPLGFVVLLLSLNANIPSYIVGRILGEAQLGLFAAMASLTMVSPTIINALGQSASARLARAYGAGDYALFRRLTSRLLLIAVVVACAGIVAAFAGGPGLLTTLYTAAYAERSDIFVLLMTAAGVTCLASVLGVALTATRCFAAQLPLGALVTLVTFSASTWLTPRFGLGGAAAAILLCATIQSIGLASLLTIRVVRPRHMAHARLSDVV